MIKHTPEPWATKGPRRSQQDCGGHVFDLKTGHLIAGTRGQIGVPLEQHDADAERIVACVNACAGMDDPIEVMRDLRDALLVASRYLHKAYLVGAHDAAYQVDAALERLGDPR